MKLKIDRAGRIVLPKKIRDRFHLRQGSDLQVEVSPDGILLRPAEQKPSLVEEDGILVHIGQAPAQFTWDGVVEDEREARFPRRSIPQRHGAFRSKIREP